MKNIFLNLLAIAVIVFGFSACQNPSEVENEDIKSPEEEIISLVDQYLTTESILLFGIEDPEILEDATVTGRTPQGIAYAQFTGDATFAIAWAIGFVSSKTHVPEHCHLPGDGGTRSKIRFSKCVEKLLDDTGCVYMYKDKDDGSITAVSIECKD